MQPILTIVTVCFNSEKTLKRCMKSVISQLNDDIEYLIIDGKSTDNTVGLIKEHIRDLDNVGYVSERDNGIYDAMNKGINMAKGEWIYFLNSDDCIKDNVLQKVINTIKLNKYDCIYGDVEEILEYKNKLYSRVLIADKKIEKLKEGMIFSHQSFFCKKDAIKNCGLFNTYFKVAGDWDLIVRLYLSRYRFYHIDEIIAEFYLGGACNKSHNLERHLVRKRNKLYKIFDNCFIRDIFYTSKRKLGQTLLADKYDMRRLRFYKLKR